MDNINVHEHTYVSTLTDEEDNTLLNGDNDPTHTLKKLKLDNLNRIIIGHININSLRNKFELLQSMISGNIDILVVTETKLDESFPPPQFKIQGYKLPFRMDRNQNGGGVIIYVREDIPCRQLNNHKPHGNLEGIFFEINMNKNKWLFFGGYNPKKEYIVNFVTYISTILHHYIGKYDNIFFYGRF